MGMPIDEAIKYLRALKRCETCEAGDIGHCKSCSCYRIGSSAKCYDAIDVGIDTMLKYQRICKILDKSDNGEQCMYDTIQEIEEVRDGNDSTNTGSN